MMSQSNTSPQYKSLNPPINERDKVAGFYAARDRIMPPLLWTSIAPPFTLIF